MLTYKKSSQQLTTEQLSEETPSWVSLKKFFVERSRNQNETQLKRQSHTRTRQSRHAGKRLSEGQDSGHTHYPVRIYGKLPPDGIPRPPSFIHAAPIKRSQEPQPDNLFYEPDPFAATPTAFSFSSEKSPQYSFPFSRPPSDMHNSESSSLEDSSSNLHPDSPSSLNGSDMRDSSQSLQSPPIPEPTRSTPSRGGFSTRGSTVSSIYSAESAPYFDEADATVYVFKEREPPDRLSTWTAARASSLLIAPEDRPQDPSRPHALLETAPCSLTYSFTNGGSPDSQPNVPADSPILKHRPVHDSGVFLSETYTASQVQTSPLRPVHVFPKHRPPPLDIPGDTLYADSKPITIDDKTDCGENSPEGDLDDDCSDDDITDYYSLSSESDIESDTSGNSERNSFCSVSKANYRVNGGAKLDTAQNLHRTKDLWDVKQTNPMSIANPSRIDSARAKMFYPNMASLKPGIDATKKTSHQVNIRTPFKPSTQHVVYYRRRPFMATSNSCQKSRPPLKHGDPPVPARHFNAHHPLKSSKSSPHLMFYSPSPCQTLKPSSSYPDTVVYYRSRNA